MKKMRNEIDNYVKEITRLVEERELLEENLLNLENENKESMGKIMLELNVIEKENENLRKQKFRYISLLKEMFPEAVASVTSIENGRRKKTEGTTSHHIDYYFITIIYQFDVMYGFVLYMSCLNNQK